MEDSSDTRADIAWHLNHTSQAERVVIGRFRRHTVGSRIGNIVDKVVDEFTGPEHSEGTAGRDAPRGMRIWVYANGECIHDLEVHPIKDDFEAALLPLVVQTARRLGASFEVYVDADAVFSLDKSWWRPPGGYRDAPLKNDLPALPDEHYAWTEDGMSYARRWPPSFLFMPIVVLLGVSGFPLVALLMLIPDTRRALVGLTKRVFLGSKVHWKWSRAGTWNIEIQDDDGPRSISLEPKNVLLFLPMPSRWTSPAGDCRVLWAVREGDAVEVPLAMQMDARFAAGILAEKARSA
ncbi:MAG: hypothetical protein AB8H86_29900 [Polyangiales bacterium]